MTSSERGAARALACDAILHDAGPGKRHEAVESCALQRQPFASLIGASIAPQEASSIAALGPISAKPRAHPSNLPRSNWRNASTGASRSPPSDTAAY